jgi:AraC-like DNA-binding protein
MLRYLSLGERSLGDYPMPPHVRVNWEFLACTRGKLAPTFGGKRESNPVANTLWLFPPGMAHGWIGEAHQSCEIAVFHFSEVPEQVERFVTERGYLAVSLTATDRQLVIRLNKGLKPHYWRLSPLGEIYSLRALLDLSLMLMKRFKESHEPIQGGVKLTRMIEWEKWLRRHLDEAPTIEKAARAVGISSCQLRRICQSIKKRSPQEAFNKIRFDRAMHLMAESDAKLDRVATETGFSTASNFCRAFKAFVGRSPTAWRREIYIQYKKPRESEKDLHEHHGRRYREL